MLDGEVSMIDAEIGVDLISTNGDKILAKVGDAIWLYPLEPVG